MTVFELPATFISVRSIAPSFSPTASSQRVWLNRWKISDPRKCAYSSRDTSEFADFSAIVDGREIPIQPDGDILGKFAVVVGGLHSRFGLWRGEISVGGWRFFANRQDPDHARSGFSDLFWFEESQRAPCFTGDTVIFFKCDRQI